MGCGWNWKVHLGMSGCPSLHERIRPSLKVDECRVRFTHAGVLTHHREQLSGRAPCILRGAITRLSPAGVKERNGHVHVEGDAGGGVPGWRDDRRKGLKIPRRRPCGFDPALGTISGHHIYSSGTTARSVCVGGEGLGQPSASAGSGGCERLAGARMSHLFAVLWRILRWLRPRAPSSPPTTIRECV